MTAVTGWAAGAVLAAAAYAAVIWRWNYRNCYWHRGPRPGCPHCPGGSGRKLRFGVATIALAHDAWLDWRSRRL